MFARGAQSGAVKRRIDFIVTQAWKRSTLKKLKKVVLFLCHDMILYMDRGQSL